MAYNTYLIMSPSRAITRLMIFCSGFLGDLQKGGERLFDLKCSHCFEKMKGKIHCELEIV